MRPTLASGSLSQCPEAEPLRGTPQVTTIAQVEASRKTRPVKIPAQGRREGQPADVAAVRRSARQKAVCTASWPCGARVQNGPVRAVDPPGTSQLKGQLRGAGAQPNIATGLSQQTARSHASPRPSLASPEICRA